MTASATAQRQQDAETAMLDALDVLITIEPARGGAIEIDYRDETYSLYVTDKDGASAPPALLDPAAFARLLLWLTHALAATRDGWALSDETSSFDLAEELLEYEAEAEPSAHELSAFHVSLAEVAAGVCEGPAGFGFESIADGADCTVYLTDADAEELHLRATGLLLAGGAAL